MKKFETIEKRIFIPSVLISSLVILLMLSVPVQAKLAINELFTFLTTDFGWLYLLTVNIILVFSLWLCFSKYGNIRFDDQIDKPEYSSVSWAAMMFTAGIGVGVVVLAFVDPISYLANPPFHTIAFSESAYIYAHMFDQYLHGLSAWIIYAPATIAIAYMIYIKKDSVLRISNACQFILGDASKSWAGTIIDILVMIGIIGGISASIGLGVPLVTEILEHLTGIPQGFGMTCAVLLVWTVIFGSSVYLGLDKGIKNLSNFNLYLFTIFAIVVLFQSPILDTLRLEGKSLAFMAKDYLSISFGLGSVEGSLKARETTVFFWAWWIAYMPMMALFVARISRGRTVRQIILGEVIWGGGGCFAVFGLFGSYALNLQKSGTVDLLAILNEGGRNRVILKILDTLPATTVMTVIYLILLFVFLATTIDSSAYVLASISTKTLRGNEQPSKENRLLWAVILLLFTLGLVVIGGLQTVQTAAIVVGFPLIFVSYIIIGSVIKILMLESKNNVKASQYESVKN